jgi:transposase
VGTKQRLIGEFHYATRNWERERRVIARLEHSAQGPNPRFVVTSLEAGDAKSLYEDLYCALGEGENRIKEAQIDLFGRRGSCRRFASNQLRLLFATLYVAEHGCKWRGLPKRFGNWHTIYTRMSRWAKSGVLDRAFEQLQQAQVVQIKIEAVSLDSTSIKVHPDGTGARKKTVRRLSASPVVDGTRRSI